MAVSLAIKRVVAAAERLFGDGGGLPFNNNSINSSELRSTMNRCNAINIGITPDDFRLTRAPINYMTVAEQHNFTIGIFLLKPGTRIPCHDHPGMTGFLKVLCGDLKITSYTTKPDSPGGHDSLVPSAIRFTSEDIAMVTNADDTLYLNSTEGNIHEICSVNGPAAFIDVLSPPYNSLQGRVCNYFRKYSESSIRNDQLVTIHPPSDFWCENIPLPTVKLD